MLVSECVGIPFLVLPFLDKLKTKIFFFSFLIESCNIRYNPKILMWRHIEEEEGEESNLKYLAYCLNINCHEIKFTILNSILSSFVL